MVDLEHTVINSELGENQQSLYSISFAEFQGPGPTHPQQYNMEEGVNRETFMSLWIESFSISRNKTAAQYLFLEWVMENYRFDYRTTLQNYVEAGGSKRLSRQEKAMFFTAYSQVPKHFYDGDSDPEPKDTNPAILYEMESAAKIFSYPESCREVFAIVENPLMVDKHLKGMSKRELIQIIDMYIRRK